MKQDNKNPKVIIAPATFGYGPASHGVSIARALRQRSGVHIWAVADGASLEYLSRCNVFDAIFPANPGDLPNNQSFQLNSPCVFIAITDFERAITAKKKGLPTVVVDALYWMWQTDPMDVRIADTYLCLAFPGVEARIRKINPPCRTLKEIPQISEPEPDWFPDKRRGIVLNFGGGFTPLGFSYDYIASVVKIVQQVMTQGDYGELLVTCSDFARTELKLRGINANIQSMTLDEMMGKLLTHYFLITLPGLSIIWEAVRTRIPTMVLPGISYSQHQLVKQYIRYVDGMSFYTWDDLPGYGLLSPDMDEVSGVMSATSIADNFSSDSDSINKLSVWLTDKLSQIPIIPTLRPDHPWGDFSGADKVAVEALKILSYNEIG